MRKTNMNFTNLSISPLTPLRIQFNLQYMLSHNHIEKTFADHKHLCLPLQFLTVIQGKHDWYT